jgi:hypothetical protein
MRRDGWGIATVRDFSSTRVLMSCRLARRSCSISHAYRLMSSFCLPLICLLLSYLVVRHEHCKVTNKGREFLATKRLSVSRFVIFHISYFLCLYALFIPAFISAAPTFEHSFS